MALKREYQVFVDEMIQHGDQVRAYKKAYPKTKNEAAIRQGCHRLSQNVTIQSTIKAEADKIKAAATEQAITELKEELKGKILTRQQKQEILYKIATGEHLNEKKKPVFNPISKKFETIIVIEKSDDVAMMKAIEIDSKMTGDYAPEKWEVTKPIDIKIEAATPEIDYEKLPTDALEALLLTGKKPQ